MILVSRFSAAFWRLRVLCVLLATSLLMRGAHRWVQGDIVGELSIDMYQTLGIAVVALLVGEKIKAHVRVLDRFCIPSPLIGGLVFAIVTCALYVAGVVQVSFDETLKTFFMVIFFASVGFEANVRVLKSGGKGIVILMVLVLGLTELQNLIAVGVSQLLGVDPLLGLGTGSIALVGGPGTAAAFGPVLEGMGVEGATTVATAAATFGLVSGSLLGGPLGRHLVVRKNLLRTQVRGDNYDIGESESKGEGECVGKCDSEGRSVDGNRPSSAGHGDTGSDADGKGTLHEEAARYAPAVYQLAIAMGLGTLVSYALSLTGLTFPVYIGAMVAAAVMRNLSEYSHWFETPTGEIAKIGDISLSLFLGIAMVSLELWQLADLAIPMLVLLSCQIAFMALFARYVIFNAMGADYDAAVLTAGSCGFGLGATANAMANMQAITDKYGPSVKAFFIVPIIGSMYADFVNSISITMIINIL